MEVLHLGYIRAVSLQSSVEALLRCTAQRDGKTLDMNYVLVFHTAAARSPRLEDRGAPDEFWMNVDIA